MLTVAYPGQDGDSIPYYAYGSRLRSVAGWTEHGDNDYDYALVTLDWDVGYNTGWLGLATFSDSMLDTSWAYIAGYPGGLVWGGQYMSGGAIQRYDSTLLYYFIDTSPGQSGSGIYRYWNNGGTTGIYVYGVHHGECWWFGSYNCGARINRDRYNLILNWMATGY